jgi:hypothetical protein
MYADYFRPLRLWLGNDAVKITEQADLARIEADRTWRDLSVSTDRAASRRRLADENSVLHNKSRLTVGRDQNESFLWELISSLPPI